jgi:hypothetical protein
MGGVAWQSAAPRIGAFKNNPESVHFIANETAAAPTGRRRTEKATVAGRRVDSDPAKQTKSPCSFPARLSRETVSKLLMFYCF